MDINRTNLTPFTINKRLLNMFRKQRSPVGCQYLVMCRLYRGGNRYIRLVAAGHLAYIHITIDNICNFCVLLKKLPECKFIKTVSVFSLCLAFMMGRRIYPSVRYVSFTPVLLDWCNKGCGMCCPVCGMMHIKEPLLLIGKMWRQRVSSLAIGVALYHMSDAI